MRGCLFVLILAAIVVVVGAWFGGPPVAGALVTIGLGAAGLKADDLDVTVRSDPPLELALGKADRVDVEGTQVDWNGLQAQRLDLTLHDVDFLGRTAGDVTGRLTGVELPGIEPPGSLATIDIEGPGNAAVTTITIDGPTVEAMATAAFEEKLGVKPTSASLSEPNVIRVVAGPVQLAGAVTIGPNGSLDVTTPVGTVTVIDADPSLPVRLASVAVENGSLVLTGTFDVGALLGG